MTKKGKRSLAVLAAGAMFLTSFNMPFAQTESKAATQMTAQQSTSAYGLSNPAINDGVTTWDCLYFGNYWQEDTNGDGTADQNDEKQPIKWRVLSVDGDDAFLLADQNLDCQPRYNEETSDVTWETSSLRMWLNSTFKKNAFSLEEQGAILNTTVINADNPLYSTKGGNSTVDGVYLLSREEVSNELYGFDSEFKIESSTRVALNTDFTFYMSENAQEKGGKAENWWLRSPGYNSDYVSCVNLKGFGFDYGYVRSDFYAIRPALHIRLSSSLWKSAGKVKSYKEESVPTSSPTSTPTMQPTVSPSAAPTITPQPANTPATTGNQALQSQQQQPIPQSGANTDTTADNAAKVSLIKQSKVSWKTAKNTKGRKLTASWKKASEADGYQIQYAPNKKFKKAKSQTVKSTSVTLKKLKKKTTYFVRVRAYKVADGKKVYGKWSGVKKVKIKK